MPDFPGVRPSHLTGLGIEPASQTSSIVCPSANLHDRISSPTPTSQQVRDLIVRAAWVYHCVWFLYKRRYSVSITHSPPQGYSGGEKVHVGWW